VDQSGHGREPICVDRRIAGKDLLLTRTGRAGLRRLARAHADLVVLSANPLTVDAATISKIVVLETIKDVKTVYTRAK